MVMLSFSKENEGHCGSMYENIMTDGRLLKCCDEAKMWIGLQSCA